MQISFNVDGQVLTFRRSWFSGRAELEWGGRTELLQDPLHLGTHVQFSLTRTWRRDVGKHVVVIEATRPLLVAGFRPHTYRVLVDNQVVAEKRGY